MRRLGSAIWWGAVFLVAAAAPLPLGAVNTWWSVPLAGCALVLGVLGSLGPVLGGRPGPVLPSAILPLALFAFLILLQIIPLPSWLVGLVSPGRMALPPPPGSDPAIHLSVYPGGTLEQGLLHLGMLYLLWAVVLRRAAGALRVVAGVGVLHAALGLFLAQAGGTTSTTILWIYDLPEVLTPFGTFVNKNHFAGLMLMGAGASLALMLHALARALDRVETVGFASAVAAVTGQGFGTVVLPGLGFLACIFAIFASGSRGAALALAAALIAVPLMAGLARRRIRVWPLVLVVVLVAGAAMASRVMNSQSVTERLFSTGRYMNRPRLWKDTLRMTARFPLTGTGLGTFPYIFPRFQSFEPERQFTHAEGDWIQYLAETGMLGALCLGGFGALMGRRLWVVFRSAGGARPLAIGAGVGVVGVVVHGFLDSSLHIPSNLLVATLLFGGVLALRSPEADGVEPMEEIGIGETI